MHIQGCAFLYVATNYQQLIKPLIISHGSGVGFLSDFVWTGLCILKSNYEQLHCAYSNTKKFIKQLKLQKLPMIEICLACARYIQFLSLCFSYCDQILVLYKKMRFHIHLFFVEFEYGKHIKLIYVRYYVFILGFIVYYSIIYQF